MTIAIACILIVAVLPIVCAGLAKWRGFQVSHRDGGYDNRSPREWIARQEGFPRWAQAAQENSWEAFPFFAAAVIVCHMLGVVGTLPNLLAVLFVVLRVIYIWCYVSGRHKWRSLVWALGWAVNVAIFLLPLLR